jgi:hypothetical protein
MLPATKIGVYRNYLVHKWYNNYFDEELFSLKQACVRTANLHTIK